MRLLASDFDGTLYRDQKIDPADLEAIAAWRAAGNFFGLCSGRAPLVAAELLRKYQIPADFIIASNGAAALDRNGAFLYRKLLGRKPVGLAYKMARELDCISVVVNREEGDLRICSFTDPAQSNITPAALLRLPRLLQFNARFATQENATRFTARVNAEIAGITAHQNSVYIDCTVGGVDKGIGVAFMADHFQIPEAYCFTIGDNRNDLPMLMRFHGAAISSGDAETQRQTGFVVPGVAALIQTLLNE
ncbi:MAG: hypothetical protein DBX52_06380 [Clostridiales bacterium]|nr:MAG: hypothetical protein DBX52_06380 [Clostridiales bacterium]